MKKAIATSALVLFLASAFLAHADSRRMGGWFGSLLLKAAKTPTAASNLRNVRDVPTRPMCFPTTCEAQGKNCGSVPDGCGGTLECGGCSGIDTCGGGGQANVCGQTCYKFAYVSETSDGVENVQEYDTCRGEPTNLTRLTSPGERFSRVNFSPNIGTMTFAESGVDRDGREHNYMNLMGMGGSRWTLLDVGTPNRFQAVETDLNSYGGLAIVSKEADGRYTLRLNDNARGNYPIAESRIVFDSRDVSPFEVMWIPNDDRSSSNRLVISTTPQPGRNSRLYVLQLNADRTSARAVSLVENGTAASLQGSDITVSRRGSRLMFVKDTGGHRRIYQCDFDLSELDDSPETGRALCSTPIEVSSLRGMDGDFASPCWSHDGKWIFYAFKGVPLRGAAPTTWDIYRDRYVVNAGERFQREGMLASWDVDERDLACAPIIYEAVPVQTTQTSVMPYREPLQVYQQEEQRYVPAEILQACTSDAQCTNGKVCREGYCRAP